MVASSIFLSHKLKKALYSDAQFRDYDLGVSFFLPFNSDNERTKGSALIKARYESLLEALDLFENLSINQIASFSRHWHSNQARLLLDGVRNFGDAKWEALFEGVYDGKEGKGDIRGKESQGLHIVCLSSSDALVKEGQKMNHCVGTYTKNCMRNQVHILSIRDSNGNSVSTIEVYADYNKKKLKVSQHRGKNNSKPDAKAVKLLNNFLDDVNFQKVKIDWEMLRAKHQERTSSFNSVKELSTNEVGFDVLDGNHVKTVHEAYKKIMTKKLCKNLTKKVNERDLQDLFDAIKQGNNKLAKSLLGNEALASLKDRNGNTALNIAIIHKNDEIAHELLDNHDVDVNASNNRDDTALHFATVTNNESIAQRLLDKGVDTEARNINGSTAYDYAKHEHMPRKSIAKSIINAQSPQTLSHVDRFKREQRDAKEQYNRNTVRI